MSAADFQDLLPQRPDWFWVKETSEEEVPVPAPLFPQGFGVIEKRCCIRQRKRLSHSGFPFAAQI